MTAAVKHFQLQIAGPLVNQLFVIPIGRTIIGREAAGATLVIPEPRISRQHAQLDCTETDCHITDLGSTNGTTLNGEELTKQFATPLKVGDKIVIGAHTLHFAEVPAKEAKRPPADREPPKPPAPPPMIPQALPSYWGVTPPGLSRHSLRMLQYLPEIYQPVTAVQPQTGKADDPANDSPANFITRFLALFEAVLLPLEWNVENFDLFLGVKTVPPDFLPWLASWFGLLFDPTWSVEQRRVLLAEAHALYARRGTKWALSRVLEIYTGAKPNIIDNHDDLPAHTFVVKFPGQFKDETEKLIRALIDANKPAHTTYKVEFV